MESEPVPAPLLRTIPLVCVECRAPLKVPERVGPFACSWCRALQTLHLEDGIAFAEVAGRAARELPAPEAETDVVAARLAMDRLAAERRALDEALRSATLELSRTFGDRLDRAHRQTLVSLMVACFAFVTGLVTLAFWESLARVEGAALGVGIGLFLGTALGNVVSSFRMATSLQEEISTHLAEVTSTFQHEMAEAARGFEQARAIAAR